MDKPHRRAFLAHLDERILEDLDAVQEVDACDCQYGDEEYVERVADFALPEVDHGGPGGDVGERVQELVCFCGFAKTV